MNALFIFIYILQITHLTNPDVISEFFPMTVAAPIP